MKKTIKPSPIASPMMVQMVGTYNEDGTANLMNAAWGGQLDTDLIVLSLDKSHRTVGNILREKAFTIGFPSAKDIADCDFVGIVSGNQDKDKLAKTGLHAKKSSVDAPYFEEFPLTYVCVNEKVIDDEEYGFYVIGRVKEILVEQEACLPKGAYDVEKMNLCLYTALDNTYRKVGEPIGKAFSIGLTKKGK